MPKELTKVELVERVLRLQLGRWSEEEMKALFKEIGANVPCPQSEIQGFIFYSNDNSAETIVDRMLAYKPIYL